MRRRFIQCDVFSTVPTRGNGLAVVVDGQGLSDEAMQRFATWTSLAETTFLLQPSDPTVADYALRIFTATRELPFAGHPTLGSCAAWLASGNRPAEPGRVRQECSVGIVTIDLSGPTPAFIAPPTSIEPLPGSRLREALSALRIDPARVVRAARLANGPVWDAIELDGAEAVLAADARGSSFAEERAIGLIGPHPAGGESDFEVRMLGVGASVREDPITGSLNAALACWRQAEGLMGTGYVASQGTAIGRLGRVHVREGEGGSLLIGGHTTILIEGTVDL